jgi:hypothetical protein
MLNVWRHKAIGPVDDMIKGIEGGIQILSILVSFRQATLRTAE